MLRVLVNGRSAQVSQRRENLVGSEQIGHKGQQIGGDLPFEPAQIAHGLADLFVQVRRVACIREYGGLRF